MSQKAMEISPFLIVFANIPKLLTVFFGADNIEIPFTLTSGSLITIRATHFGAS